MRSFEAIDYLQSYALSLLLHIGSKDYSGVLQRF